MKKILRKLAGLLAGMALAGLAYGQSTTKPQIPPGWTEQEAIQWQTQHQDKLPDGMGGVESLNLDLNKLTFMAGKKLDCKNMLGGLLKCCKKPVPDANKSWWDAYRKNQKKATAVNATKLLDHVQGAWSQMDAGADHWDLSQSFTSSFENLLGGGGDVSGNETGNMAEVNKAFMNDQNTRVKPNLQWYCDDSDFETAVQRNAGTCHYLGSRCQSKVLGTCLVKKEIYCCFNSPMSRMMREELLKQGVGDMGTAKNPNCAGIPMAQMMSLNIGSEDDLNEIIGRMQMGGFLPDDVMDPKVAEDLYTGSGNNYGNPNRVPVSGRTEQRLDDMDYQGSTAAIEADVNKTVPTQTSDAPTGPGEITFATGFYSVTGGSPVAVSITRNGGSGMVSVVVSTQSGTAQDGRDYSGVNQTVYWGQGDVASKTVTINTNAFTGTAKRVFRVALSQPTGGAVVTPYTTDDVELLPEN
ncbi:conjugal transfer protein TraN [Rhodanobacter denitrificans]|uniref:conjugal transfer protein TraN n=1 Tax=Rhodanobacter denitrificans TaxID=666685 RepID=UPI001F490FB3|nr:conjugal transfer protein TraN [Rhodanobacter denitrificans]UJJ60567.1 conjugal transfer protein TraN [Rhodanobacter denitrificans]